MTAILFTIAAIMLVWLVVVSPGVIRKHRVWRRYEALRRSVDGVEAALRSLAELAEAFAPTPEGTP